MTQKQTERHKNNMTTTDETIENKCCECNEQVDVEGDYGWSNVKEDYLCLRCRENDESSVSTVHIADAGIIKKYYIGNHVRMTEFGDDLYGVDLKIDREWVSSDAWRGHFNTTIKGWTEVLNGWTTGAWDDPIAQRKFAFNEWAGQILKGEIIPPVSIAIITDPTSNVFSTGIGVLTSDPEAFKEWLGTEFDDLHKSLS